MLHLIGNIKMNSCSICLQSDFLLVADKSWKRILYNRGCGRTLEVCCSRAKAARDLVRRQNRPDQTSSIVRNSDDRLRVLAINCRSLTGHENSCPVSCRMWDVMLQSVRALSSHKCIWTGNLLSLDTERCSELYGSNFNTILVLIKLMISFGSNPCTTILLH